MDMSTVTQSFLTLFSLFSFLCLCLCCCSSREQSTFSVDGLNFMVVAGDDDATVTVTGFTDDVIPDLAIPATVDFEGKTYLVTVIGDSAFYQSVGLKSLTLPANLTAIGNEAFCGCRQLCWIAVGDGDQAFYGCHGPAGGVTLPAGLTKIGKGAFYDCNLTGSITLPASLTEIGEGTFCDCDKLTSVTLQAVTPPDLGEWAFAGIAVQATFTCPSESLTDYQTHADWSPFFPSNSNEYGGFRFQILGRESAVPTATVIGFAGEVIPVSLSIPVTIEVEGVTYPVTAIGAYAFDGCSGLTGELTLPVGLTAIGSFAFYKCSGLTGDLTLPACLTTIGNYAFVGCYGLTSATLQSTTPPALGNKVFTDIVNRFGKCEFTFTCPEGSLTAYRSAPDWAPFFPFSQGNVNFYIKESKAIITGSCVPKAELITLTIPAIVEAEGIFYPVTGIGYYAFYGYSGLTSLILPKSLTEIDWYAFCDCSGLTGELTLPAGLTEIGGDAFRGCSGLTSMTLPAGLTSISFSAFYNCSGLTSLTFPKDLIEIGDFAFCGCTGLTSLTFPKDLTEIGDFAFCDCAGLTSLTFPAGLASIGDDAFQGCDGLTGELKLPAGLTKIGDDAFWGCDGLTSVKLPASLTSIGGGTFHGCSGLTGELKLPAGLTKIGDFAFKGCSDLTSVTFPEGLTKIGGGAFEGCSGLASVTLLSTIPPTLGYAAFGDVSYDCNFLCPKKSRNVYRANKDWKEYFTD
jgi:hypothetical protein